eukprot:366421-Chlamydomonas_euryale.AAC.15
MHRRKVQSSPATGAARAAERSLHGEAVGQAEFPAKAWRGEVWTGKSGTRESAPDGWTPQMDDPKP